jgi:ATP-dependent Clp protease adaptor protein ClpS
MHNDDFTSMEFVVEVLMSIFRKDELSAILLMQAIHLEGLAICGVYPKEIAETKVIQTKELAKANKYPLKCTMEEE